MKRLGIILLAVALFMVCVALVTAEESPATVTRAAHCSESAPCAPTDLDVDGTIEDWEIQWHDLCGQFTIRYLDGTLSADQLPDGCLSLPPADYVRMHT